MEKTDLQEQFKDEQDREAVAEFSHGKIYLPAYGSGVNMALKLMDKATAYDRLMSGGKKTLKEVGEYLWVCRLLSTGTVGRRHVLYMSLSCISMRVKACGQIVQNITEKKCTYCLRISLTLMATGNQPHPARRMGGSKMSTIAKLEHVVIQRNESPYPIPYGQLYCPICNGQIDTGFRCMGVW